MPGNIIPELADVSSPSEARTRLTKPLEYSGLLDLYQSSDLTPVIGREYYGLQVADVLAAKNSDALIRDIAVTGQSIPIQHINTPRSNTSEKSLSVV